MPNRREGREEGRGKWKGGKIRVSFSGWREEEIISLCGEEESRRRGTGGVLRKRDKGRQGRK